MMLRIERSPLPAKIPVTIQFALLVIMIGHGVPTYEMNLLVELLQVITINKGNHKYHLRLSLDGFRAYFF